MGFLPGPHDFHVKHGQLELIFNTDTSLVSDFW